MPRQHNAVTHAAAVAAAVVRALNHNVDALGIRVRLSSINVKLSLS